MKKNIIYIVLTLSVLTNVFVLAYLFVPSDERSSEGVKSSVLIDSEKRFEMAKTAVRKLVCDDLYYPNSYDPVNTTIDSVFYSYMTDEKCINAAIKLIDLRDSYSSAKANYEQNDWTIRFHGNPKGPFLERERNERAESEKEMKRLSKEIKEEELIIKNRDSSNDGKFIGWQVVHKYRASNSKGVVSFGNVMFVFDSQMKQCYYRFSLDDNGNKSLVAIKNVIEQELGVVEK